ncbi:MAG TPA: DsbA family protein [Limnobacter sp.]|uniref:DsbA family protein n=1 Tax=Limnobacter sp. TaxID=2003368 RepID=UPI002ED8F5BF
MSIKSLLMPAITERVFSEATLHRKRAKAEVLRLKQGRPHTVHYFHQVDDPYSALLVQVLPSLLKRYAIELSIHVCSPPDSASAPERAKLEQFSRQDAQRLANRHGLAYTNPGQQPNAALIRAVQRSVLTTVGRPLEFLSVAHELGRCLWTNQLSEETLGTDEGSEAELRSHLAQSDRLRESWGHYLGGMLYYEGEWYWGLDRLHHLETRLKGLHLENVGTFGHRDFLCQPDTDPTEPFACSDPPPIDFYFSFRSPYSAIVAPRVFELARLSGAKVNLKYVLPMVMRGLPVPKNKRQYIAHDTAREARFHGIPFGRLNDPVGRPAERGLALIPFAERHGRGQAYVLSFMKGVWSEGLDAGSDRGLCQIVERAGLNWRRAQQALQEDHWRMVAEANRHELFQMGLWGVPSFRVGKMCTWGQDRLWLVREALQSGAIQAPVNKARETA